MWGIESIPPQAGGQHLALKLCRQEVGLGLPFCQLHMSVLRSSEASPQKCPLLTSSQVLLEDQASIWDPRHLQLKPDFEGKTRPIPLQPAARVQAVPNRRGFVPGEAPGHGAVGNSPREGEATHICLPLHSHGVPPHCQHSQGRGGGCKQGPCSPMGRVWPPSVDHGAKAQPRGPAQEQGNQLQEYPSLHQAFADPSLGMIRAGRFPAGFCIRPQSPWQHLC